MRPRRSSLPYGGGPPFRLTPVADRREHADRLRDGLAAVAAGLSDQSGVQKDVGIEAKRRGVTMVALSRVGQELATGNARRSRSKGLQLLSVRRGADAESKRGRDRGIYFVTSNALKSLNRALATYETWREDDDLDQGFVEFGDELGMHTNGVPADRRINRPSQFKLFESAASFRVATIEDLWTDTLDNFPRDKGLAEWEVWVRSESIGQFAAAVLELGLDTTGRPSDFVDVAIYNVVATRAQLGRLIVGSAAVVELRGASNFLAEHVDLEPTARLAQVDGIAARVTPAPPAAPWVTLLDTGVQRAHPLLAPALPANRCTAVAPAWDAHDADGHGTKMAGVALYGDLADVAAGQGPVPLPVGLESVAVFSPPSPVKLPARDAIRRGVLGCERSRVHPRVYCLAATVVGEAEDGRPSSTSATLDALAFNDGKATRLFCVAVGNVNTTALEPYQVALYAGLNEEHGIQSPAQALNVLSVGAATRKCSGPEPLADDGDLSPRSRTAQAWAADRPHKPDILMEGGNHGVDPGGATSRPHAPDMVATTSRDPVRRPITFTGDTSAACAAAAGLAGRLMARYPAMRAETVRGLIVHNAQWTDAMLARQQALVRGGMTQERAWRRLLDCFGWGIPDEERVFWSAGNALTLIAEDEISPYGRKQGKGITLKEMKSLRLPWPDDALRALGGQEVELRCTLSYFVAPDPHSAGLDRLALYPSHRLKFDFQRSGEDETRTLRRVNKAVSAQPGEAERDEGWLLGWQNRARGTLNHDIWRGPAYQLVGRRLVTVVPIRGWWAVNGSADAEDTPLPFSLIVSIRTPEQTADLVAEARTKVPATATLVDVPSIIRV